jgi:hypothetical protein
MFGACAMLPSVACPALQYLSTLSHEWHDFRKEKKRKEKKRKEKKRKEKKRKEKKRKEKVIDLKCVFCFSLKILSATVLILRRTERDMIKTIYIDLHLKNPLFLSDFNVT